MECYLINSCRFKVIHAIEKILPLSPCYTEWNILGKGEKKELFLPFAKVERLALWTFIGLLLVRVFIFDPLGLDL